MPIVRDRSVISSFDWGARETSWREKAGRLILLAALVLSIVARGAVTPTTLLSVVVLIAVATSIGSIAPPAERRTRRSFYLALVLAAALAAYLIFQSWSYPSNVLANALWSRADSLIGVTQAAISVDPDTTRGAIFALVTPFLFYAAALALFAADDGGLKLMRWLAYIGVGFAVFGLVQVTVLPDSLLFFEKTAYRDSLTSVFVNRNTAGTLLGVASLVSLTLVFLPLRREGGARSFQDVSMEPGPRAGRFRSPGIALVSLILLLLAMFLTKSRGALFATAAAYVVLMPLLAMDTQRWCLRRRSRASDMPASGKVRPLFLSVAATVAIVAGLVALFGGLALDRMETRGIDAARLCVYRGTLEAFSQNWAFGTGFGTFSTVFPIYRLPGCGNPGDVFLRAHNVFLEGLLGLGVPFLALVLVLYGHIGANLFAGLRVRRRLRFVPLIAIGAVILVTLHSLVDFSLQIPGMAAYFATYLAAVTTLSFGQRPGS